MTIRITKTISFVVQSSLMGLGLALLVLLFGSEYRANLFNNAEPNSYAHAVRRAASSVVGIHTASTVAVSLNPLLEDPLFKNFFRIPATADNQGLTTSLGSGVIVAPDGYILTNFHVVSGADRIQVVLYDGRIADAEIVGADPETDIAVLHISYIDLPNIVISDSNNAKVGDIVLAIGNPLGIGQTVTQGIVSATGRNRIGINTFENFIQTDAAINPGNSGGALIDVNGDLIGINSAILGYQGIGFAIPTSIAVDIMRQLIQLGTVERGWIGIKARDLSSSLRADLKATTRSGIAVLAVLHLGPADNAGIRPGDVITHIAEHAIKDSQEAIAAIAKLRPGSKVQIRGTRAGESIEFETEVAKQPVTSKT